MALFKKTITLGLDSGEFTGGITDVNRKMKLLDEEFKLAQEQAKGYGNETDVLKLKQSKLGEQIQLQTKKVELSKEKYDKALESGKATDKQLDNLKLSYIKNQTELQKLNNELSAYSKESEEANEKSGTFGDTIRGLASSLGLEVSPALESVASKFDGISKETGTAILGIGAIVTSFAKCTIEAGKMADDLLTLSTTTHITTDELQKMRYASNLLDVDVDTMTGSITKLTNNMESARDGSKTLTDQFKKLGIRITDSRGNLRDANQVFYEAIDALGKVKNETERDALAMDLFGKSAKDLNPLIEAGSDKLKELGIQAENMGMVMGQGELDKLGKFNDVFEEMGKQTDALKNSLGLALLPILTGLFEAISKIPVPVLQTIVVIATIVSSIVMVVKAIKSMTDTAKSIKGFFTTVSEGGMKTSTKIMLVVAALIALAAIIAVIIGKSGELDRTMSNVGNSINQVSGQVVQSQNRFTGQQYHALGTDNFSGGRTFVGENGVEEVVLPQGSKIIPNHRLNNGESNVFYVTIDAKNVSDFNRVVEICKQQKQANRRGVRS